MNYSIQKNKIRRKKKVYSGTNFSGNVIHRNAMFWFEICTIWTVIPVVNRKNWCESMPNIFRTENRLLQEWCEKRKYFWEQLEKWDFLKTEQSDWLQSSAVQSTMSDFWLFYLVLHNFNNKTFLFSVLERKDLKVHLLQ